MESMTMGKRIMTLRKEQGLTQEQLAEKMGVSAQAVSKWENDISCPDISIIPQLADVLRVSTDELLGARPMEPRVVVVGSNGQDGAKKEGKYRFEFTTGKFGGIVFAIALVAVGVCFLLQEINILPFSVWSMIWPSIVLAVGVCWLIRDRSVFGLGVALLGLYFLLFNLEATTFRLSWGVIWPALLILLGIQILLDKVIKKDKKSWTWSDGKDHTPVSEFSESDGYIHYDCAFSEDNRRVNTEEFSGGNIDMSFGKSVLDLTSCKRVRPGALLDVDVSFGSFELLVPRCFVVKTNEDKAFGSITVKGSPDEGASNILMLKGDVSFGSLTIRYI